jgi:hypothetical protein
MTEISDTPTSPTDPSPLPGSTPAPAPPAGVRLPSRRATAALAAVMLAVGVAVGAAIGPAPDSSLAGASRLPLLLPALRALSAGGGNPPAAAVKPPAATPQATPPAATGSAAGAPATPSSAATSPSASSTPEASKPSAPAPTPASEGKPKAALPPVTHVWLIELSGTSFADALAQPAAAPYINTQAIHAGALLSGYSALDGSAFASEAALLASTPPQLIDTIVQPPCPEGAAGAQCTVGTPGGLTAADEFLKAAVPTITATAAYRSSGLIVITFGSIASSSATELPSGAATATLTSQPPAGVLLISPFVSAGTRPSTPFNPASPRKSLEGLLHK